LSIAVGDNGLWRVTAPQRIIEYVPMIVGREMQMNNWRRRR
jgi:hypothetical protein